MTQPTSNISMLRELCIAASVRHFPIAEPTCSSNEAQLTTPAIAAEFTLTQWTYLKENAPSGPIAIRQMMKQIEKEFKHTKDLAPGLTVHEEYRKRTSNMGLPNDLKVNMLFTRLKRALDRELENSGFQFGKQIPTSLEQLTLAQQNARQRNNGLALELIWRERLVQHFVFDGARVPNDYRTIRSWLNDPAHAAQINQITALDLKGLNLKALPTEIGNLRALMRLDIGDNQISELPNSIRNLTALEELFLDENQFSQLPDVIGQLQSLRVLSIKDNLLKELPETIGNLNGLTELHLDKNFLRFLPGTIGNLTALQCLQLDRNRLIELPQTIGNLARLELLFLSHNNLEELPASIGNLQALSNLRLEGNHLIALPQEIGNLHALTNLDLENNDLMEVPESLGNLGALTRLFLCENHLKTLPDAIGNLHSLITLSLHNNELERIPDTIGNLTAVTSLSLHDNCLSSVPDAIGNLAALQDLSLDANKLSVLPETIGNLRELKSLSLYQNQLTYLPDSIGALGNLQRLFINDNLLCRLPRSIGNLTRLQRLTLHNNRLISLTSEIGNLRMLMKFTFANNQLAYLPMSFKNFNAALDLSLDRNPFIFYFSKTFKPQTVATFQRLYNANVRYKCETPLARLFQTLIRVRPRSEVQEAFQQLPEETRNLIAAGVRRDAGYSPSSVCSSSSSSCSSEYQDLFHDMLLFARTIRKELESKWEALPQEQIASVYEMVARLQEQKRIRLNKELTPELKDVQLELSKKMTISAEALETAKRQAFDVILRLIDAVELTIRPLA